MNQKLGLNKNKKFKHIDKTQITQLADEFRKLNLKRQRSEEIAPVQKTSAKIFQITKANRDRGDSLFSNEKKYEGSSKEPRVLSSDPIMDSHCEHSDLTPRGLLSHVAPVIPQVPRIDFANRMSSKSVLPWDMQDQSKSLKPKLSPHDLLVKFQVAKPPSNIVQDQPFVKDITVSNVDNRFKPLPSGVNPFISDENQ